MKRLLKSLIELNFHISFDGVPSRIGRGNRQHEPNGYVRSNPRFYSCRAGMEKNSGLRRLLGDFERDLRRQVECRGQQGRTGLV